MISLFNNLAYDFDLVGKWDESIENYAKALKLAGEYRDAENIANIPLNLGILFTNRGDDEMALEYLDRSIASSRMYAMDEILIHALISKADAFIRQERWDEVAQCINESERVSPDIVTPRQQGEIYRTWALIHLAQSHYDLALEQAQKAINSQAEVAYDALEQGISYRVLGQVMCALGQMESAIAHFATSLSFLNNVPYEAARTHLEWSRTEHLRGCRADGLSHRAQALEIFERLGAKRDIALATAME
jgi:tetratricopeptide (TPR) repeat protein